MSKMERVLVGEDPDDPESYTYREVEKKPAKKPAPKKADEKSK